MKKERDLKEIIARSVAFANREDVERPLYGISRIGSNVPLDRYKQIASILPSNGLVLPEMIAKKDFLKDIDRLVLEQEKVGGDLFFPAVPFNGLPWMEAIVGCSVHVSSGVFWAAPQKSDWNQLLEEIELSEKNVWLQKLLELQTALVEHAKGKYPIGTTTMMRGPGDMMGAVLGQERLVFSLYDDLKKVKSLASQCTKTWMKVAKAQHRINTLFHGGHVQGGWVGLWMPGMCQYMQDDALAYFSPKFYREVFLEYHRIMTTVTQYSLFHLHPTFLYAVDDLLYLKNLDIIEVHREITGPSIEEILPILKKIHDSKALFISWCYDSPSALPIEDEIRYVLKHLSPKGLCLHFMAKDVDEGRTLMRLVDKILKDIEKG